MHDCLNVRGQQNASRGGYVCVPGEPRPGDKGGGGGGGGGDPGARQGVFWVVTPDGRGRPGPGLWFLGKSVCIGMIQESHGIVNNAWLLLDCSFFMLKVTRGRPPHGLCRRP